MTDVLLRWLGVKVLSTADDVADYEAGVLLKVSCSLCKPGARQRSGHLYVQLGEAVVWRSVGAGQEITLSRPLTLRSVSGAKDSWPMGSFVVGGLPVKLPLADVEFLEYVVGR
jgi:hypothetical protein